MKKPYNIKDINFDNIVFSKLIDNGTKRSILLKYAKNRKFTKFLIQTPEMQVIDIFKSGNVDVLVLSVDETDSKIINFIKFFSLLDNHVINVAKNNSNWFFSNNVKFKGSIRNDNDYDVPYIKLKLNSNLLSKIKVSYDKQTQTRSFSDIEKNQTVKLVIDLHGIWINNAGFGLYMKPIVIDIRETNEITLNESSEEDEEVIDTEINPVSETSVLNLNTEVLDANDRMSSEMDSITNLINLEIEDLPRDSIIENSENDSSYENNINLQDDNTSSSTSVDSFNVNTNTSTDCNDINNH